MRVKFYENGEELLVTDLEGVPSEGDEVEIRDTHYTVEKLAWFLGNEEEENYVHVALN